MMKLYFASPSPYARRCRVLARELGLMDRIDEVVAVPYDNPADLLAVNPLAKIPALVEDDGTCWYDSAVLNRRLLDLSGPDTAWPDLKGMQMEALVTGITDAAFWIVTENRRTDTDKPSEMWLKRWHSAIDRGLVQLEAYVEELDGSFGIPEIGAAVALGYLDFRRPDIDWRGAAPGLETWYVRAAKRKSMMETVPQNL